MGTVGYMSPEQVRGAPADHRSDVFALGAILYEMLSGRRAFKCDTTAETMTAILKEEPAELTGTNPAISPGLQRIVHRCLEKEPAQRFQSASDLGFALESLSGTTSTAISPGQAPRALTWRRAAVAALVLAALLAGWVARSAMNPARQNPAFHQISYRRGTVYSARLSSDGKTIVYTAAWDGNPVQTYVVSKEFPESRPLDVKESVLLSISSSGDLAVLTGVRPIDHFEFQGTLSTMPMGGGAPREMLQGVTAADYSPDGQSLAVVRLVSGKYRLEYPSGKTLFETAGSITQPRVSRDGKRVAFLFHPVRGDDRGGGDGRRDAGGKAALLSDGWGGGTGAGMGAGGDEVWFSASKASGDLTLHAVTLPGKTREVFAGPGGTRIFDIGPDGRFLVSHNDFKYLPSPPASMAHRSATFPGWTIPLVPSCRVTGSESYSVTAPASPAGITRYVFETPDGLSRHSFGGGSGAWIFPGRRMGGPWRCSIKHRLKLRCFPPGPGRFAGG